jgi:hypothetical protein
MGKKSGMHIRNVLPCESAGMFFYGEKSSGYGRRISKSMERERYGGSCNERGSWLPGVLWND